MRKDGVIEHMRDESEPGAHACGYNAHSLGVCYEGGLDMNGHPADTRTPFQKRSLLALLRSLKADFPEAVIKGHRDLSPDVNGNSEVMKEQLVMGKIVDLGEIGKFQVSCSSSGVERKEDFCSSRHVKGAKILFRPSKGLKEMLKWLRYEQVAVR